MSEDGTPLDPSNVVKAFRSRVELAGVPKIPIHDLRRTSARLMIEHEAPAVSVADRLGPSDPGFTLRVDTDVFDT